jgi:hypothetical protein
MTAVVSQRVVYEKVESGVAVGARGLRGAGFWRAAISAVSAYWVAALAPETSALKAPVRGSAKGEDKAAGLPFSPLPGGS